MNTFSGARLALMVFLAGCATTSSKPVIWETKEIPGAYEVIGPVSVTEAVTESTEEMIQGLAGFITKDGRVSNQIPAEMRNILDVKREKYRDMIFDKLSEKAKTYDADAIISAEYFYLPPIASFSSKASVSAKGMMVRYK